MALQGTLEDFGIADIFQLIGQQQKTGVLVLTRKEQVVHIFFNDGNIINAETQHRDKSELLGQMLLQADLINEPQLKKILDLQKKTLQKLGTLLIENQLIHKSDLDEFIYLQTKETIFRLFRWNSGTYQFHQQDVSGSNEFFTPISAEHILMDGFRIIDEWPALRKKIGSFEGIYYRSPDKMLPTQPTSLDNNLDQQLDQAFSESEFSTQDLPTSLSHHAQKVLHLIDGESPVYKIIARSRLGEFDCCQAIASLIEHEFVQIKETPKENSKVAELSQGLQIDLYQDYGVTRGNWFHFIPTLLYYSFFTLFCFLFLMKLDLIPNFLQSNTVMKIQKPVIKEIRSHYYRERLQMALESHFLKFGFYPRNLSSLVREKLLLQDDLQGPWKNQFGYHSDGSSYRLEEPFL